MTQSQSRPLQAAFDHFREITQGLRNLHAEGQVPFLKYELLLALERADELREQARDLERQLAEHRARAAPYAQLFLDVGRTTEVTALKTAYEERLQLAEGAYCAMKRRCSGLEERCQSLLPRSSALHFATRPGTPSYLPLAAAKRARR